MKFTNATPLSQVKFKDLADRSCFIFTDEGDDPFIFIKLLGLGLGLNTIKAFGGGLFKTCQNTYVTPVTIQEIIYTEGN